jgi:phosphonatase-like hydrolase
MRTALVVFDMAGTTVSDKGNVNKAFRDALAEENIMVGMEEVNTLMGYRKIEAITRMVVKQLTSLTTAEQTALIEKIHDRFNRIMVDFYQSDADLQPLPFAEELFRTLQDRGIKVALNTGFTRVITDAILQRLGWNQTPMIDTVICSDEVPEGRPYPYMIQSVMQKLGITDTQQVVKVGDTEVDVNEGRNAGCGFVAAVTTGAYTREQLLEYRPDVIIDSLQELPAFIL